LERAKSVLGSTDEEAIERAGRIVRSLSGRLERTEGLHHAALLEAFKEALGINRVKTTAAIRKAMDDHRDAEQTAILCVRILALSKVEENE
jgi:hypothetical protein